jgi:hypothetical protein
MYKEIAKRRSQTHMHVIGSSGTGKSKFLEWLIRQDVKSGKGFCVIDWHGTLYRDVLDYMSVVNPKKPVVLLNPSAPSHIVGFNPFMVHSADIATAVARRMDAILKPWGMANTNEAPTLEKMCRLFLHFAVLSGETLPISSLLLRQQNADLRDYAIEITQDTFVREMWMELQKVNTPREWREQTMSTTNRLARFISSENIRRFMSRKTGNVDLFGMMERGGIVLVNLAASDYLDRDAGRVFASLLLNEFFESAMRRALVNPRPTPYPLYLDEFQEYITENMASMLDQVRKGGLHLVMAHQRLGHLQRNPELLEAILTNARIRAVFAGLPYSNTEILALEMSLKSINERRIKETYYRTVPRVEESTRVVISRGRSGGKSTARASGVIESHGQAHSQGKTIAEGSAHGFGMIDSAGGSESESHGMELATTNHMSGMSDISSFSEMVAQSNAFTKSISRGRSWSNGESGFEGYTESETITPYNETYYEQEKTNDVEWSREEKISIEAERLNSQDQRECVIKMLSSEPVQWDVPLVKPMRLRESSLKRYEAEVSAAQGGLPAPDVDRLLIEDEQKFMQKARKEDAPFAERRHRALTKIVSLVRSSE